MNGKQYLLTWAFALFVIVFNLEIKAAAPPNFIFFITDDISVADLEAYGGPIPTPNLNKMVASGVRFENAYVTASSCSPSRSSIITSRYPHNSGSPELHTPLPQNQWKFPGRLRRNGYYSALSGKNHMTWNGVIDDNSRLADAFDDIWKGGRPSGSANWVQQLRKRPKDKPFFYWLASHDAHREWQFTEEASRFSAEAILVPPYHYDGPETREDLAGYYHEVARTDYYLGLIFEELERQGLADNTYVIYTSDNGRPFPRDKTRLYDSGSKVPLVISGPGVPQGKSLEALVSLIDIGPTILELADIPIPEVFQGVSLVPLLLGRKAAVRDYIFVEHNWHTYPANERMVRLGDWVYIRNYNYLDQNMCAESGRAIPAGKELWDAEAAGILQPEQRDIFLKPRPYEEFYNVRMDPNQFENFVNSGRYAEMLNHLRKALDVWTQDTGDTIPENPTVKIGNVNMSERGEFPGAARNATEIQLPGPILRSDVE
ncbi:sulfatase [Coraliomargarita sp. SDUM461004]|uniref:Sulfatase n=1 Tax=Thalassobacterium sedimentorum TaxID=3041258 RepID=A0ABU1AE49_9BACT|nr:sulfatase [Coraliomargarita sp. SDUM461004]MDQ8192899.1 sulfatase [Coraliomargarita sp. SDUM461004]